MIDYERVAERILVTYLFCKKDWGDWQIGRMTEHDFIDPSEDIKHISQTASLIKEELVMQREYYDDPSMAEVLEREFGVVAIYQKDYWCILENTYNPQGFSFDFQGHIIGERDNFPHYWMAILAQNNYYPCIEKCDWKGGQDD